MNIKEFMWDKNSYKEYIDYLISLEDIKYKNFNKKIVNTKLDIIGICLPKLRSIAKEIVKGDYVSYLDNDIGNYYEEVMIYGLVLSCVDEKIFFKYLIKFLDRVDNWAICDSFCSNIKSINNKLGKYWIYFNSLIDLDKEFYTRVSIVIFMNYYLREQYIDRVLKIVSNIRSDYYYINMSISWLLSEAIIDYPDKVLNILESKELSKFVQNKTISKINDSYRIDEALKERVKLYRVK